MPHPPIRWRGPSPLVPAAAIAVVLVSAHKARRNDVGSREEQVFRCVNNASNDIEFPVWAVMQSGSLAAVFAAAAERKFRGHPELAMTTLGAGVGVWAGVKMIKPLIGRGRPDVDLLGVAIRGRAQTGLGYPSGHSAVAMTLALVISQNAGAASKAAALSIAGATGVARMYVGAHLPLDVAGGLGIGLLCGRAASAAARTFIPARNIG